MNTKRINIILLGYSGVGKTNIINSYCEHCFIDLHIPTLGFDCKYKAIIIEGKKNIYVNLYDTPGQEKFKSIIHSLIKKEQIFIMVYDVTNRRSFEELNYWKEQIDVLVGKKCVIGVVGNKIDLLSKDIKEEVSEKEALDFAKKNDYYFRLLSAKYHECDNFINELVERYIETFPEIERNNIIYLKEERIREKQRKTCCQFEIHYPFIERYKARVFPWYRPMWEFRKKNNSNKKLLDSDSDSYD